MSEKSGLTSDTLVVGATLSVVVILLTSPLGKSLFRGTQALLSRIHLSTFILTRKPLSATTVTGLFIHPIKSLRAVPTQTCAIDKQGFVDDRRFMLVTPAPLPAWGSFAKGQATHRFLTQRQCPSLATVVAQLDTVAGTLTLSSHLLPGKKVTLSTTPASPDSPKYLSTLWGSIVEVQDLGNEAAADFVQRIVQQDKEVPEELKEGVRLVVQTPQDGRTAKDEYVPTAARSVLTGSNPATNLSDGFPLLLANESSLEELNRRLIAKKKSPIDMSQFRPNIVVKGLKPFEEDEWKVIRIGGLVFYVVKNCARCKLSCTEQTNGKVGEEPLETMADFRAKDPTNDMVYFAQNIIPAPSSVGKSIVVGDKVEVLEVGEPVWGD